MQQLLMWMCLLVLSACVVMKFGLYLQSHMGPCSHLDGEEKTFRQCHHSISNV